jgi:maltooligosyltrehalose trehalohydrolase
MQIGANYKDDNTCEFTVWAPRARDISLKLLTPVERLVPMQKNERGYWRTVVDDVSPGTLYFYFLERERDRPDPASYFQPHGVHKASQVVDHNVFDWRDSGWQGMALSEMIMYEVHIGTFTSEGTIDAMIPLLDDLKETGINTIEIMPVAQFAGERNWGYDGVYPFAVQNSYGGPEGLKLFVNECHIRGMAVILDVVYNHLGPEGNYLRDYGTYFTDRYKTPWGDAINFDGPYSDGARTYFIENALYWFKHYHIDALRLDAIHGIYDMSARPFLFELAERVEEFSRQHGRKYYLIAESDLNNSIAAISRDKGGYGITGLWNDDFHHAIHTLLTGETDGYYLDFGRTGHLIKSLKEGFVYSGQYSEFRKRSHGNSSKDLPADRFIVFSQNHDQIGNRMLGERLSSLVSFDSLKLAAGIVLLSPYIPLLFMGEEYGETAPFLYFVSHSDPNLIERVRYGRKKDFEDFNWEKEPPDPQSFKTFKDSRINWDKRTQGNHKILLNLYKELIRMRRVVPALANLDKSCLEVWKDEGKKVVFMRRWKDDNHIIAIFNFNKTDTTFNLSHYGMEWERVLDSSDKRWNGPGTLLPEYIKQGEEIMIRAESFALYISNR